MRFYPLLAAFSLLFLLTACGTDTPPDDGPLLPMPGEFVKEPDDAAVKTAVSEYLAKQKAPVSSVYDFNRVDLDSDRRRDALVLFNAPYGYWCDPNGCPMLILHANEDDFTFVGAVQDVRGPIYISKEVTNGWRDLMVRISGRWSQTKDVTMQYDGSHYPAHPDTLPPYDALAQMTMMKIFR